MGASPGLLGTAGAENSHIPPAMSMIFGGGRAAARALPLRPQPSPGAWGGLQVPSAAGLLDDRPEVAILYRYSE
jgi:hypothetical protein